MKSYLIYFSFFILYAFNIKNEKDYYIFKTTKTEKEITTSRFILTEDIDLSYFKKNPIKGMKSFSELNTDENYYQIIYTKELSLNEFRNELLKLNSDFDKEFIIVTDKAYYNN